MEHLPPPPPKSNEIVWHGSLSLKSEVVALTFYPHLLLPPVAAGYAAFFTQTLLREVNPEIHPSTRQSAKTKEKYEEINLILNLESLLVFNSLIKCRIREQTLIRNYI